MRKLSWTTEYFVALAREAHGSKYDYSVTRYVNTSTKIEFICPTHGLRAQYPKDHLRLQGCASCARGELTEQEFITRAKLVHGERYLYDEVRYAGSVKKVEIICREHGSFCQKPYTHLDGDGCPKCGDVSASKKLTLDTADFIRKARKHHGDKYDYSKSAYVRNTTPIEIVCPEHGAFWQVPCEHKRGRGCIACAGSFNPESEATLYYARVQNAYKIGVTSRRVIDRYQLRRDQEKITVLVEWKMLGREARRIEQSIIREFSEHAYKGEALLHAAGVEEMFAKDILPDMCSLFPELDGDTGFVPYELLRRRKMNKSC